MYRSMLDMHRMQQRKEQEQVEIDKAYGVVRSLRMKQSFAETVALEVARKKRWRAYRTRR